MQNDTYTPTHLHTYCLFICPIIVYFAFGVICLYSRILVAFL